MDPHGQRGWDGARLTLRHLGATAGARGGGRGTPPGVALTAGRRRGATRLVPRAEHEEERVQLLTLLGVERCEELVLHPAGERAQPRQRALAVARKAD